MPVTYVDIWQCMNEDKEEKLFRWLNTESRGVIFDMDGLMLDTEVICREALGQAAGYFGYTTDDELIACMIGRKAEDCERLLVDAPGRDFPQAEVKEAAGNSGSCPCRNACHQGGGHGRAF